jgi:hypothetical protein
MLLSDEKYRGVKKIGRIFLALLTQVFLRKFASFLVKFHSMKFMKELFHDHRNQVMKLIHDLI